MAPRVPDKMISFTQGKTLRKPPSSVLSDDGLDPPYITFDKEDDGGSWI